MNQILVTGDESINKGKTIPNGQRKLVEINAVVIFYAISIIILGICMISGSIFVRNKINQVVEDNTKPVVDIVRNDDNNTIELNISHIRGIQTIEYRWNSGEEVRISGNNKQQIQEVINLLGGTNILTVKITEENGQTVSYKKEFTVGNIPEITLEAVSNGVKVTVSSEKEIDYITYSWDGGEIQTIEVGQNEYVGTINAPKGIHKLKIEAVNINNIKGIKEQTVVGDTEPTLNITAAMINGKPCFVVDAEDDEQITNVEIVQNEGTKQVFNVNDKTYHNEVEMIPGINKILVTVYNKNGLSTKIGRQFNNE